MLQDCTVKQTCWAEARLRRGHKIIRAPGAALTALTRVVEAQRKCLERSAGGILRSAGRQGRETIRTKHLWFNHKHDV